VQEPVNQVVVFQELFKQAAEPKPEDDKKDKPKGSSDIVVTDAQCKPS